MKKKLSIFLCSVFIIFFLIGCSFFKTPEEESDNWERSFISYDNKESNKTLLKAFGNSSLSELKFSVKKTSGDNKQWYGLRFNYIDSNDYYEFAINNEGYFKIDYYGSEVLNFETIEKFDTKLKSGKDKINDIELVISDAKLYFYANVEAEENKELFELAKIDYTKLNLGRIYFFARTGAENLSQDPLKVYFTVYQNENEESNVASTNSEGWSVGKKDTDDEGYDVYFTKDINKYNTCDFKILSDNFDGNEDNSVRHFSIEMIKDSGALNYGGAIIFAAQDLQAKTQFPTKHYALSIDPEKRWKLLKLYVDENSISKEYEVAKKSIDSELSCVENTNEEFSVAKKLKGGLGSSNKFTIRRVKIENVLDAYSWYIWINPTNEITSENYELFLDEYSLILTDKSKTKIDSGLIGFGPGVGSEAYEDLPSYPVKYRFKNIVKQDNEDDENDDSSQTDEDLKD